MGDCGDNGTLGALVIGDGDEALWRGVGGGWRAVV